MVDHLSSLFMCVICSVIGKLGNARGQGKNVLLCVPWFQDFNSGSIGETPYYIFYHKQKYFYKKDSFNCIEKSYLHLVTCN